MEKRQIAMKNYYEFPVNMSLERWKRNMFFTGVQDTTLSFCTCGGFPETNLGEQRKTHPIFVLHVKKDGPVVCPCSRKNWYDREDRRYIVEGAITSTQQIIRATTYLVEEHRFRIPRGADYIRDFKEKFTNAVRKDCIPLYCMGIINDKDIRG